MSTTPKFGGAPIRFGAFELDPRSGELRSAARVVRLAEQPLRLLLALLERPGQVVTRDELCDHLWPGDTFVDYEHGLNAAVKRLRDALGDTADIPKYIETLPRRGYRLLAVTPEPVPPDTRTAVSSAADARFASGMPRRSLVLAVALLLAALVPVFGWVWYARGSASPVQLPAARPLTRVTVGDGLQTDVTWSPDGTRVAYASDRGGSLDIWVQALDGSEPIAVASSSAPNSQPAWSPTGDRIVFRSERDGGGLFVVSATGGPARRLTTFGFGPAWQSGGSRILFTASEFPAAGATAMYSVGSDGATPPTPVLGDFLRDGTWYFLGPRADGRVTAIGHHRRDGFGVYAVTLDGASVDVSRPPPSLADDLGLDESRPTFRAQWDQTGSALYLEVTPRELSTVWRVPAVKFVPHWDKTERLTSGPANAIAIALAPDGRRLAFTSESRRSRAWVFPFDPRAGRLTGAGRPVTGEDTRIGGLRFADPDGRSLLYTAWRVGRRDSDVMMTDVDTGSTRLVASGARSASASADGRMVAYLLERPRGPLDSADREYALAVRDSSGSERLVSGWSHERTVSPRDWTTDGSATLASYWKPYPSGPVSLVLWPVHGGPVEQPARVLLAEPGRRFWQAGFSPDGRHVSFVAAHVTRPGRLELGVMDVTAKPGDRWTRIAADHNWPDKPRWAPDGRMLYFISRRSSGLYNLWGIQVDPASGRPTSAASQITHFDSPTMAIDPNMVTSDIAVANARLAVTMRHATGSIWMLSDVDR